MNFWKLFRLIFVFFSLYLIGDAFYRWDAFDYYGSFLEFLPGIALISGLWSFLSLLTTVFIWLLLSILKRFFNMLELRITFENSLIFLFIVAFLGLAIWYMKTSVWPLARISLLSKFGILIGIVFVALLLTFMLRNRTDRLITIINERITPLVWLFGVVVLLSVPLLIYIAWSNQAEKKLYDEQAAFLVANEARPNILLITFDALTARDMSVYGYNKETTPFISEWAKSASVFTRNQADSNYTAPTTASLMTGKRVWTHRRFQSHGGRPDRSDIENLPLLLKIGGYYNMAFIANEIASVQELGMVDSFMVAPPSYEFISPECLYGFIDKSLRNLFGSKIQFYYWILQEDFILYRIIPDYFKYPVKTQFPAKKVFDMFLTEINDKYREPYFAWIHVYPPHMPYLAPEEYSNLFGSSSKFRTAKSQDDLVRPRYFVQDQQPDADSLRNRYDEFIRYCDKQFQDFIEQLEKKDLLKNTVIILSSDHGESFEHGYFTHGGPFLYEQMTNIPLIIKEPGQTVGKIFGNLVEQIDTSATILDFAGIPSPSWIEGRSLIPLLQDKKFQPKPVFSMSFEEIYVTEKITKGTIAVWEGDYKLVHYFDRKETLLFDMRKDPLELDNIIDKKPEVGEHLFRLIEDNLKRANDNRIKD